MQEAPDLSLPYIHQASIGAERAITPNLQFQASYQMLRGRNLMRAINVNAPDAEGVRPEPTIGTVTQFESTGRSTRDSLNVNIGYAIPRRQMNLGMNYMLARFLNDADNATQLPVNSYKPDLEWGSSSAQDIRHRVQANLFLPPLFGVRAALNGLVYQSGSPYNITTGRDDNHDLVINDRPLDASGHIVGRNSARGAARWGDMSLRLTRGFSFGVPGAGRTASAAPLAQPGGGGGPRGGGGGGFQQANNRFNFEIFAEADNVLNRVNFTNYAGTMTSRLFGQPTASLQARRVQVGFQFRF